MLLTPGHGLTVNCIIDKKSLDDFRNDKRLTDSDSKAAFDKGQELDITIATNNFP